MDKQIVTVGDFIPAEVHDDSPLIRSVDLRTHKRISLKQVSDEDLAMACDGITVTLYKNSRLGFKRRVGIASVKDLSLGGLGLLCNSEIELGSKLNIRLCDTDFKIRVVRSLFINKRLTFYGCKWESEPENKIVGLTSQVQQDFRKKQKN